MSSAHYNTLRETLHTQPPPSSCHSCHVVCMSVYVLLAPKASEKALHVGTTLHAGDRVAHESPWDSVASSWKMQITNKEDA